MGNNSSGLLFASRLSECAGRRRGWFCLRLMSVHCATHVCLCSSRACFSRVVPCMRRLYMSALTDLTAA